MISQMGQHRNLNVTCHFAQPHRNLKNDGQYVEFFGEMIYFFGCAIVFLARNSKVVDASLIRVTSCPFKLIALGGMF